MKPIPQWIDEIYKTKGGRDHLGVGSVSSDQILPSLAPGINVLTYHPRYFSFYIFLLDEYWRRDLPRSRKAWVAFYRPKAYIYSLAVHLCPHHDQSNMSNVVGSQKVRGQARANNAQYDVHFKYIDSDLGGYGLYYRVAMATMGLLIPGGRSYPLPVDTPTEQGKRVAEAFRIAIKETVYYQQYFNADEVPREVVAAYGERACLCQLRNVDAPDRALLRDIYLMGGIPEQAAARRETLRLILDIAQQTEGYEIAAYRFRQLLLYGEGGNGAEWQAAEALQSIAARWRLYQAREYYTFALNGLFYSLCDWGTRNYGDVRPVSFDAVWEFVWAGLDFGRLATIINERDPQISAESSWQALIEWIESVAGGRGEALDAACRLHCKISENNLHYRGKDHKHDPTFMIAGMITLLAVVARRFEYQQECDAWRDIATMGGSYRRSLDLFLQELTERVRNNPITIGEVAEWIMRDYIIDQHQMVAMNKLPDNSLRFQREGRRLRFFLIENPLDFLDSRFDALSTTAYELGWCGDLSQAHHPLTADGVNLHNGTA